jgi:alpha-tubulin suppressor-like RCC1 family protein
MRILPAAALATALLALAACSEPNAPRSVVGPGKFTQVSAGGGHACAVDTLGRGWCWGSNGMGAVGIALQTCHDFIESAFEGCITAPTLVSTSLTFTEISAGRDHSCGLTAGGEAYCWGSNASGQLGTSATVAACERAKCSPSPVAVSGGWKFRSIAAGSGTTCAVTIAGVGKCWGDLLGPIQRTGGREISLAPATVLIQPAGDSTWDSFARPGVTSACGIAGQRAVCWGENIRGQLGLAPQATDPQPPMAVGGDFAATAVVTGSYFGCALDTAGLALCWGGTDGVGPDGMCSAATIVACSEKPSPVGGAYTFTSVSSGPGHLCGVLSDRPETRCWGGDVDYAVGVGSPPYAVSLPYVVTGFHPFTSVSAGEQFACGLTTDRNVWCWGSNRVGQLGVHPLDGRSFALIYTNTPVLVGSTVRQ